MTLILDSPIIGASSLPFVIETEEQYERALAIVEALFLKTDKTPLEGQLLEVWAVLIENYEQITFAPRAFSNPVSALCSLMETRALIQADLVRAGVGSRPSGGKSCSAP